eukprot:scaffold40773_cov48-Phaeocystis_antarctica.AAC.4
MIIELIIGMPAVAGHRLDEALALHTPSPASARPQRREAVRIVEEACSGRPISRSKGDSRARCAQLPCDPQISWPQNPWPFWSFSTVLVVAPNH